MIPSPPPNTARASGCWARLGVNKSRGADIRLATYPRVWGGFQKSLDAPSLLAFRLGPRQTGMWSDANVQPTSRYLLVTGGPGTGKTEVVIHAAVEAAAQGCRMNNTSRRAGSATTISSSLMRSANRIRLCGRR